MQATLSAAAACLALAIVAGLAERRRARRDGPARVGWVPWSGLVVLFLFAGLGLLAVAIHR